MNKLISCMLILSSSLSSGFIFADKEAPRILANSDYYMAPECEYRDQYADGYLTYDALWCNDQLIAEIYYIFPQDPYDSDGYGNTRSVYVKNSDDYRGIVNSENAWVVWKK
ncbi:hypothetical protein [Marinagarivorans algicola]|uniref:hypothetical protein n=1 Tax=Marinagarivorans algicola TaxID=1513270 RepID=UPI0006B9924F|nr:hypothetical protein [Marinagarivorans algicola]